MKQRITAHIIQLLATCFILVGCSGKERTQAQDPVSLFNKVTNGMTKEQVEAILGHALLPAEKELPISWYLPPPNISLTDSPFAPGSIGVEYRAGVVHLVILNPQVKTQKK